MLTPVILISGVFFVSATNFFWYRCLYEDLFKKSLNPRNCYNRGNYNGRNLRNVLCTKEN